MVRLVSTFSLFSNSRLYFFSVCMAKPESQDIQKHPEGRGAFLLGLYLLPVQHVPLLNLNSKVACSICVAGAVLGGSGTEVLHISVGISMPLTTLLICMLGILSTSLILFFL